MDADFRDLKLEPPGTPGTPGTSGTPGTPGTSGTPGTPWMPAVKKQRLSSDTPFNRDAEIAARTPFLPPPSEAVDYLTVVTSGQEPRTVLVCGDMYGRLDVLHAKLIELKNEVDLVLAVGQFLPPNPLCSRITQYVGSAATRTLPVPVYFIDCASEVFIKKHEVDRKPILLSQNLTFLGSCGITELAGLRIAYLSGSYDEDVFKQKWGRGMFTKANYTSAAVERIEKQAFLMRQRGESIDILLTSHCAAVEELILSYCIGENHIGYFFPLWKLKLSSLNPCIAPVPISFSIFSFDSPI